MQFSEAVMEYSFDCKIRKLSAKTIENYQKQLRYLQRYLEQEYGVKEVEEVRAYQIKEFASILVESTLFLFVLFVFCGVCANIDLSTRTNEP